MKELLVNAYDLYEDLKRLKLMYSVLEEAETQYDRLKSIGDLIYHLERVVDAYDIIESEGI